MSPSHPISIEAVMLRHGPFLRRLARALVRDEQAAEDLVHDTWLAALRSAPAAARDSRAWLATVLRRRAISLRRRSGTEDLESAWRERARVAPAADETTLALERERLLHAAVARLAEPYRTAVFLRYHEGLMPRAIAARTDVPVKTVNTRLARGLDQLRADLDRNFAPGRDARAEWLAAFAPFAAEGAAAPLTLSGALLAMKFIVPIVALVLLGVFLLPRLSVSDRAAERSQAMEVEREAATLAATDAAATDPVVARRAETGRDTLATPAATEPVGSVTGSIEVIVTDADGQPIAERAILLDGPLRGSVRREVEVGRTGLDGHVVFNALAARRYRVADGRGGASEWLEVARGETRTVEWTLTDTLTVRGRVVHADGSGAGGATLWGVPEPGGLMAPGGRFPLSVADDEGQFELRVSQRVVVQAALTGFTPSNAHKVDRIPETQPGVRSIDFTLGARGSPLVGRVLDPGGDPVVNARVVAGPIGGSMSGAWVGLSPGPVVVRTDVDGRFVYPQALPAGQQEVAAYAPAYAATRVKVTADGTMLDVELRLTRPSSIVGRVLLPDGTPAVGADITASRVGESSGRRSIVPEVKDTVDEDGRFELRQLSAGSIALVCLTRYDQPLAAIDHTVELEVGATLEVELTLSDQPVIAGRIVDGDGVGVEGVAVSATVQMGLQRHPRAVKSAANGSFRLTAVPALAPPWTSWTIEAYNRSESGSQLLVRKENVEVGAENLVLVVDRPEAATAFLEGRLVASTARVPADAELTIWRADTSAGHFAQFDADSGRFRFGPVTPGLYRVQVRRSQEIVATKSGIKLLAGETVDVGSITFGSGGHVVIVPRLADLHGLPAEVEGILMSEGRPILKDVNGRTIWLEAEDDRWVSTELIEPGTWTFSATGEKTIYPTFDLEVTEGETTEAECVARLGYDIVVWMALPSEPSWSRAMIRVEDPGGTLVHETNWMPRDGLDPAGRVSARLTLPIGGVVITVETDTDVGATESVTVPPFGTPIRELQIGAR